MFRAASIVLALMFATPASAATKVQNFVVCGASINQSPSAQWFNNPTAPAILPKTDMITSGGAFAAPLFAGTCPANPANPTGTSAGALSGVCDVDPFQTVSVTTECGPNSNKPALACPGANAVTPTPAQISAFCNTAANIPVPVYPAGSTCVATVDLNSNAKYSGNSVDVVYTPAVTYTLVAGYEIISFNTNPANTLRAGQVTCLFVPTVTYTAPRPLVTTGKYWIHLYKSQVASVAVTSTPNPAFPPRADANFVFANAGCDFVTAPPAGSTPCRDSTNLGEAWWQIKTVGTGVPAAGAGNVYYIDNNAVFWKHQITITYKKNYIALNLL